MLKYLQNILLLALSFVFLPFRGRAAGKPKSLERILVVQSAKIGDMICVTPVFHAIKRKYPRVKLSVVASAINEEILRDNPDVDEYIVYHNSFLEMFKAFRKRKFDAAFLTTYDVLTLTALYLSGVPLIVAPKVVGGPSWVEPRTYKLLLKLVCTAPHNMYQYVPREFLRILEPIDIFTDDTKKHLAYSDEAMKKADEFLAGNDINPSRDFVVGIAPSAGNKIKNWYPERYARLIEHLREKYQAKIILIGGKGDAAIVENVLNNLPDRNMVVANLDFNLGDLKALIARLSLFISGDTGPIHIADAFDIPTVDILGPVGEVEMPPRGPLHRNAFPPRERAMLYALTVRAMDYDLEEAKKQMEETTFELVRDVVDGLISDIKPSK